MQSWSGSIQFLDVFGFFNLKQVRIKKSEPRVKLEKKYQARENDIG